MTRNRQMFMSRLMTHCLRIADRQLLEQHFGAVMKYLADLPGGVFCDQAADDALHGLPADQLPQASDLRSALIRWGRVNKIRDMPGAARSEETDIFAGTPPEWQGENAKWWPYRGNWRWWKRKEAEGFPGGREHCLRLLRVLDERTGSHVARVAEQVSRTREPYIWETAEQIAGTCAILERHVREFGYDPATMQGWQLFRRAVLARNAEYYPMVRDLFGPRADLEAFDRAAVGVDPVRGQAS